MCTNRDEKKYSKCEVCGLLIDDTDKVYDSKYNLCNRCKRNINTEKILKYINFYNVKK